MAWRKWLVRSLVFSITAGLAVAGFYYQRWTDPEKIRAQVLEQLGSRFPGAHFSVDSAQFHLFGGIARNAVIRHPRAQLHLHLFHALLRSLEAERALFFVSVVGIDPIIAAEVQTQKDYSWRDLKFGHRFVEIYHESEGKARRLTVDYGRLHDTEPVH